VGEHTGLDQALRKVTPDAASLSTAGMMVAGLRTGWEVE
jgi:hypothetical protein